MAIDTNRLQELIKEQRTMGESWLVHEMGPHVEEAKPFLDSATALQEYLNLRETNVCGYLELLQRVREAYERIKNDDPSYPFASEDYVYGARGQTNWVLDVLTDHVPELEKKK